MAEQDRDARKGPTPEQAQRYGEAILLGQAGAWRQFRSIHRRIPSSPRCKMCASPFSGPGGALMRAMGRAPYPKNPNYCSACFRFVSRQNAGAEIPCSLLFADVRGSTTLAEGMTPAAFRALMSGFFRVATAILVRHDGMVDKFVGDEVVGLFIPALTGDRHAERAVTAARELLASLPPGSDGRPLPVGAGVQTGIAYVGTVGDGDAADFTAMGDPVNVAARLASAARAGEVLVTAAAAEAAGLETGGLEHRSLELKGKSEPVDVVVVGPA